VKIFTASKPEELETKINAWLGDTPWVKVKQISQSAAEYICISVWYDEPDVPILG